MKRKSVIGRYRSDDDNKQFVLDLKKYINNDLVFFCIGTDRSTGDSFAPLVGTILEDIGYQNVMGTIDNPIHALNITEKIEEIPKGKTVIAIDACLGRKKSIGDIIFEKGSLRAGIAIGKELPSVGDYSIKGIVNINTYSEIMSLGILSNTRLSTVINLSRRCVSAVEQAFPLDNNKEKLKKSV